jgi:hypothetical protein
MKKVVGMLGFILISGLISFIPANAGDCSPEDPCMTYAEVDASGKVVNTIVCQPSVCRDEWGGKNPNNGNSLVPQVAADANGQNRGGILPNQGSGVTLTESNGTFTLSDSNANTQTVTQKVEVPATTIVENNTSTTTSSASETNISATTSNSGNQSFTLNDTVNPQNGGVVDMSPKTYNNNTSSTVSANKVETNTVTTLNNTEENSTQTNTTVTTVSVEQTFDNPVTEEEFANSWTNLEIFNWNSLELDLIMNSLDTWLSMLEEWFLSL